MMSQVGSMDPGLLQNAARQMQNMSPADLARAQREMGSMDPAALARQAEQASTMLSGQQQYIINVSIGCWSLLVARMTCASALSPRE
jgi:hypothetical protein